MNARELALKVINEVNVNKAYANIALAQELNRHKLSDQDRRFATELVYGTVKSGPTLDWMLSMFVTRSLEKVAPVILDILRMGIYQLVFLSKVPASAACNQSVELAKKYGHSGTVKFVNGVLRGVSRNMDKIKYPNSEKEPAKYLSLKYFHPEWLVKRWLIKFGFDECERLCQVNNQTPPLSLRTNTIKITRQELIDILHQEGVVCEPSSWTPEGIACYEHPALSSLNSLKEGLFQIQDESSMMVAHVLDPKSGDFIIDVCGAPGGKSTHIAALMQNTGKVVSSDIHPHKLNLVEENARRLSIDIIQTKNLDAAEIHKLYTDQADRVLVDAPCSGLGVLRRKPDSRWRKTESMLTDLPVLQYAILSSAAKCVKPGGVLVYSTCTTELEENQQVVERFLKDNADFSLDNPGDYLASLTKYGPTVQLMPHRDGVDGFFIARLKRM